MTVKNGWFGDCFLRLLLLFFFLIITIIIIVGNDARSTMHNKVVASHYRQATFVGEKIVKYCMEAKNASLLPQKKLRNEDLHN